MEDLKTLTTSFEITLKDSNLQNITIDLAEAVTDSFFNDGIIKDIPILNTLFGLGKTTLKIRDYLFFKKIIYFLSELKEIPINQRESIISKIDSSKEYRIKVGEKLLYIIDKCDDHEKSQIIARLFSAFIKEIISYPEFLKATSIINRISIGDLSIFINGNFEELLLEESGELLNYGLFEISQLSISIEDQWDHKASEKYIVNDGELKTNITSIGKIIRKILK